MDVLLFLCTATHSNFATEPALIFIFIGASELEQVMLDSKLSTIYYSKLKLSEQDDSQDQTS